MLNTIIFVKNPCVDQCQHGGKWIDDKEQTHVKFHNNFEEVPILYNGPPLPLAAPIPPSIPTQSTLVANIIASSEPPTNGIWCTLHSPTAPHNLLPVYRMDNFW
jgi:hypothetical protein